MDLDDYDEYEDEYDFEIEDVDFEDVDDFEVEVSYDNELEDIDFLDDFVFVEATSMSMNWKAKDR